LDKVTLPTSVPPRSVCLVTSPIMGIYCNRLVTTVTAQYESWSNGSKYPVKFDKTTSRSKVIPNTHVACRGFWYAPVKRTLSIWRKVIHSNDTAL